MPTRTSRCPVLAPHSSSPTGPFFGGPLLQNLYRDRPPASRSASARVVLPARGPVRWSLRRPVLAPLLPGLRPPIYPLPHKHKVLGSTLVFRTPKHARCGFAGRACTPAIVCGRERGGGGLVRTRRLKSGEREDGVRRAPGRRKTAGREQRAHSVSLRGHYFRPCRLWRAGGGWEGGAARADAKTKERRARRWGATHARTRGKGGLGAARAPYLAPRSFLRPAACGVRASELLASPLACASHGSEGGPSP
jgi:hypothetical protein